MSKNSALSPPCSTSTLATLFNPAASRLLDRDSGKNGIPPRCRLPVQSRPIHLHSLDAQ